MADIIGLPGTDGKPRKLKEFGHSVSGLVRLLKKDGYCTAANNNGSINVWKDDSGAYRAERHCYYQTQDSIQTRHLIKIKDWLKKNYPVIL